MAKSRFKRKVSFAQVSNVALRDDTLSLKAKGLYSLIQSYITLDNFILYKEFLESKCREKRDSFNSAWKEIKDSGYLLQAKLQSPEDGKFFYEYELLDEPISENPEVENPEVENPEVENPEVENPDTGKSTPILSIDSINTDLNNTPSSNTDLNNTPEEEEEISQNDLEGKMILLKVLSKKKKEALSKHTLDYLLHYDKKVRGYISYKGLKESTYPGLFCTFLENDQDNYYELQQKEAQQKKNAAERKQKEREKKEETTKEVDEYRNLRKEAIEGFKKISADARSNFMKLAKESMPFLTGEMLFNHAACRWAGILE